MNSRNLLQVFGPTLVILILIGCSGASAEPAATPVPPTLTPVPPTATPVPPTASPTPSPSPTPRSIPDARGYHHMVYDAESDRIILFGGSRGGRPDLNDTWAYDFNTSTWEKMMPTQSPDTFEGPMTYDAQSDRVILFQGSSIDFTPISETWAYDFNTDTWTDMEPAEGPSGLIGPRMVYDAESDRVILFGGIDAANISTGLKYLDDTWAYDWDSNSWTKMEPELVPLGRNYHAMAYDSDSDRVIMWGGHTRPHKASVWSYDYNTDTWEELETSGAPEVGNYSSMVYVPETGKMVLFGGVDGDEVAHNDTWAYNYENNTWHKDYKTPVDARGWQAMTYITGANRIIIFGGGPDRNHYTDELWVYDPTARTWESMLSDQ